MNNCQVTQVTAMVLSESEFGNLLGLRIKASHFWVKEERSGRQPIISVFTTSGFNRTDSLLFFKNGGFQKFIRQIK